MAPRSLAQRKADTLALLENEEDAWIATAGTDGIAHLVPLSVWWDGEVLTMTTTASAPTARNAGASRQARVAFGDTRDVVVIDTAVETIPVPDAPESVTSGFVAHTGWNPEDNDGDWVYLRLTPRRVQAWREADEIDGRTIMRDGCWLD